MRFLASLALLSSLLTFSCSEPAQSACAEDRVIASDAWVRATRPGQNMSAGYLRLCNGAEIGDRLVAVSFDGAEAAELHTTSVTEDGIASMAPVEGGLELPAGQMIVMEPGGAHIMLIGVSGPLSEGETRSLTLQFENAEPLTVPFEVRSTQDAAHDGH